MNSDEVYGGFTGPELQRAFDRVRDPENWKMPIDAVVRLRSKGELDATVAAVAFFTGSACEIVPSGHCWYRVRAAGYYACIGA